MVCPAIWSPSSGIGHPDLIAGGLILTGFLQLAFTAIISDRLFERRADQVLLLFVGALQITMLASSARGAVCRLLLHDLEPAYQLLMLSGFIILRQIWIATISPIGHEALQNRFSGCSCWAMAFR